MYAKDRSCPYVFSTVYKEYMLTSQLHFPISKAVPLVEIGVSLYLKIGRQYPLV